MLTRGALSLNQLRSANCETPCFDFATDGQRDRFEGQEGVNLVGQL